MNKIIAHAEYVISNTPLENPDIQVALVLLSLVIVKPARLGVLKLLGKIRSIIFGKNSKDLSASYSKLAEYSIYESQRHIFKALQDQYLPDTKFVVLPMDMEFMNAGSIKTNTNYYVQMDELKVIKERDINQNFLPFVFVDPRRIEADPNFFQFSLKSNKVVLNNCHIKDYIEDSGFHGIKIYPALGYYPFDESLLPLWLYAAEHALPIMTHCIKGTIYYRGPKKMEWYEHPVFKEFTGSEVNPYAPLLLIEGKGVDYSLNFTHPLNYMILLNEQLLRHWVSNCSTTTKTLFGFTNIETPLKRNLRNLKVCFAHFGGEEHWKRYLNTDRNFTFNVNLPHQNKSFVCDKFGSENLSWGKIEYLWKHADWYSLICRMLQEFSNTYADISYILYNKSIYGLLGMTMKNPNLKHKVLYGTDFYVVRNHGSERSLLSHVQENMNEDDFDLIARTNPRDYLRTAFGNID